MFGDDAINKVKDMLHKEPEVTPSKPETPGASEVTPPAPQEPVINANEPVTQSAPVTQSETLPGDEKPTATPAPTPQLDPLAAAIDRMRTSGKSAADIQEFVNKQLTDYSAVPAIDAMKAFIKAKYPTLSDQAIEAHIAENYRDYDDENSAGHVRLNIEADAARQFLISEQAKALELPDRQTMTAQAETKAVQEWAGHVPAIVDKIKSLPFEATDSKGFSWKMDFAVPEEDLAQMREYVFETIRQNNIPVTPENIALISKRVIDVAQTHYLKANLADFIRDAYNKGVESTLSKQAGFANRQTPVAPNPGVITKFDKLKKAADSAFS